MRLNKEKFAPTGDFKHVRKQRGQSKHFYEFTN